MILASNPIGRPEVYMDSKAFFNLSYGVFVLGAKSGEKINACIINTCMQVASNPIRVAISVLNKNLTCQMIKETDFFTLSVLDKTCTFNLIKNFGMQSGRDVNKFESFPYEITKNGIPYITSSVCSLFECKVISSEDLGTHTLFVAEVQDATVMSENSPLTYADYQNNVKSKVVDGNVRKIIGWRCEICGYEYMYPEFPDDFACPICGHLADDFKPIYEPVADKELLVENK